MQPYAPPPPRPTRNRWVLPVSIGCGGMVLILIVLAVIGTVFGPPEPAPSPAARPASTAPAPVQSSTPPPTRRERPAPTPAQAEAYLKYIGQIDPGLVADRERALRRADGVCDRIINPRDGNVSLEEYTAYMLSGGNAQIDKGGQARRIIAAVKVWCH